MSFIKNKKPIETWVSSNGWTRLRWKKRHADDCSGNCSCCVKDWDCNCGAITWEAPKK